MDESTSEDNKITAETSVFSQMPPKFAFWAGAVTAAAIFSLVTLVVVIVLVVKGVNFQPADNDADTAVPTKTSGSVNTNGVAANPPGQNTNAAANANTNTAPAVTGTVDLDSLDHVQGSGDWTLVEYSDFDCSFCKQFHPTTKQVVTDYDGKVKLAYKHFPLNIHPQAAKNALAAECAGEQGKFFEFGDELFATQSTTAADSSTDSVLKIADGLGLDQDKFKSCLDAQTHKDKIQSESADAQALGCTGTPCPLLVDKDGNVVQKFAGAVPYATIKAALDAKVN